MNIVCTKCGAGVAFELASLVNQTAVSCSACRSGLKVTIEAFDVPAVAPSQLAATPPSGRRLALVAVQGEATRELIRDLLVEAGFEVIELSSGKEALAKVGEAHPALALVDVGLSDMPGFQVCEAIRAGSANAGVKMILVAAIHNKDRYRRLPDKLFGADDFVERHQIESQLVDKVSRLFGDGGSGGAALEVPIPQTPRATERAPATEAPLAEIVQEPSPIPASKVVPPPPSAVQPASAPIPAPSAGTRTPDAVAAQRDVSTAGSQTPEPPNPSQEAAMRLARIIVSDIALYNAKKVDEGILNGTFFDVLRAEIEEGRKLYEERKGSGLTTTADLFQQTLEQFVATRRELLKRSRPAAA